MESCKRNRKDKLTKEPLGFEESQNLAARSILWAIKTQIRTLRQSEKLVNGSDLSRLV